MEPEIELLLYVLTAFSIACGLFYGMAFVVQRVRLLWIEIESNHIDMLAKRANVKMALDQNDLQTQVIRLDENGLAPISRRMIDSGMTTEMTLQLAHALIDAQRTHAPVPHTLSRTYAPHIKQEKFAVVEDEPALLEAAHVVPKDFLQLYQAGELPSNQLSLGFDMDADMSQVNVGWESLYNCLIGGLSGMGKSTFIRSILAQSAMQGGRFVVLDPHFLAGEESLGASLAPLRPQMLRDVAHDDKTMLAALNFVADAGKRRLEGKDKDRSPLILIVDETTMLLSRSAIAGPLIDVLSMISQETRKVHVYAMCIGQNFAAEIMKSTARDSFVSMISCRARRKVARIQADSPEFGLMAAQLERGQVVWMAPSGEIKRLAVPNCTAQHLESVKNVINAQKNTDGSWSATGVNQASGVASVPISSDDADDTGTPGENHLDAESDVVLDAEDRRALDMFYAGSDIPDIIQEVWGLASSAGRPYRTASKKLQAIIRGGAR
ncbi:MAG: type IV secretory system conjugative DNA transfer family protein [Aureliella sp.]